jgi:O-antigen/teichoic acid export membrane protein
MSLATQRTEANAAGVGSRLRDSALWVAIGRTLGIGITAALGIVLPRLMGKEDYANFRVILTIIVCSVIVGSCGMNGALVRILAENLALGRPRRAKTGLRHGALVVLLSSVVVAILVTVGLHFWGLEHAKIPASWMVVVATAVAIVLLAWQQVAAETLRGLHEFRWSSILSGGQFGGPVSNILFLLMLVILVFTSSATFEYTLLTFVAAFVITAPLTLVVLLRTARRVISGVSPAEDMDDHATSYRDVITLGVPLSVVALLAWITSQSDILYCDWYCNKSDVALYAVSRQLTVLIAMPLQMVNLTIISTIPDLKARGLTSELQRVVRWAALAAVPSMVAGVALIFAARPVLKLLYGADYVDADQLVAIMTVGQILLVCAGSGAIALAMTGFHNVALAISALSAATLLILGPVVTSHFGAPGLAMLSTGVVILECGLQWLCTRRLIGVWTHFAPVALARDAWHFISTRRSERATAALVPERPT